MQQAAGLYHSKKLYGLDLLRSVAILMVMLYHYRMFQHPAWLDDSIHFGWSGVDLFFVLSGYLIASPLFLQVQRGERISFPVFFIKRTFRILPAYWFVLTVYFLMPAFHEREALPPLWKFLSFTQNFGFNIKTSGTFSHVWSLCVEEHFYLLLPLALFLLIQFKKFHRGWVWLIVLFVVGVVVRMYSWYAYVAPAVDSDDFGIIWYKYIYYPTYNRFDGLLTGVTLAAFTIFNPHLHARLLKIGNVLLGGAIVLLIIAGFFCSDQMSLHASVAGYPLLSAGYGLLVLAAINPSCMLYKINSPISAWIAKLSFSMYLLHKGVIHTIQPWLAKAGIAPTGTVMLLVCFTGTIMAAWILHVGIEQPFLRWRSRILQTMARRSQTPAALRA